MLCPMIESSQLPNDIENNEQVLPESDNKYVKITKKIKKSREKSKPKQSNSLKTTAKMTSSKTLRGKTIKILSLNQDRTPLKMRKETKDTESNQIENDDRGFTTRNLQSQIQMNAIFLDQNLATYMQKEVFFLILQFVT